MRSFLVEMESFSRHLGSTSTSFCCFSTGSDEAVADTSRRVGGALARKSALKTRLSDAVKQLQAAERGKHQRELKSHLLVHWSVR